MVAYKRLETKPLFPEKLFGMQVHPNLKNILVVTIGAFFIYLGFLLWGTQQKLPDILIDFRELINYSVIAAEKGGYAVRKIHEEKKLGAQVKGETKEGAKEFVTKADLISNQLILKTLERAKGLLVVSEEKKSIPWDEVVKYDKENPELWNKVAPQLKGLPEQWVPLSEIDLWIDPLDATQEYTEDLTEYVTVMVCIAVRGRPKFGVIYRPFTDEAVWGLANYGVSPNSSLASKDSEKPKTIIVSRSHAGEVEQLAKKAFGEGYTVLPAGGSGYKSLKVLNGTAEMYLHQTAIKKWDLCAADAIIRAGGGSMTTLKGQELTYFHSDSVLNTDGLLVTLADHIPTLSKLNQAQK